MYLFPSTVPEQGSIPALDPSSLAPRTSAVAKVWNAKKSAIIIAVVLVIALAAAGSGFTVLQRRDSSQMAFDACQQAITINQKERHTTQEDRGVNHLGHSDCGRCRCRPTDHR